MARRDYDDDDYTEDEEPRRAKSKVKSKTKDAPSRRRDDDDDDDIEEETPRSKRRSRDEDEDEDVEPISRKRRARRDAEEDDDEDEDPRSRRRRRDDDEDEDERPARRRSRREEDDDDEEDEDDDTSRRSNRRRRDDDAPRERGRGRERGRSRRDEEDDEDDEDDEDEAPRSSKRSGGKRKLPQGGWGEASRIADSTATFAKSFNLKPGEPDTIIKFLEDQPYVNFRQHWIDELKGKKSYTCLEGLDPKGCPLCDMGHKPSAKFCFNILVMSEHDDPILRSFDVGVQLKDQFLNYNDDKATGPLTKHYYVVKRPAGKNSRMSVQVVRGRDLDEDYGIEELTKDDIEEFGTERHDKTILEIPTHRQLSELRSSLED